MDEQPESFDSTARLIRRAHEGDQEARSLVMRRFQKPLLERVRQMMGRLPREFAESGDVLQDLFLEIIEAFDGAEIRDEQAFLRWATHIARNNIRDQVRRQRLRAMETLASSIMTRQQPVDVVELKDEVDRLREALRALPDQYRQVIELKDIQQLSYRDIAEIMERSGEAATQMLHARALARLTSTLSGGHRL